MPQTFLFRQWVTSKPDNPSPPVDKLSALAAASVAGGGNASRTSMIALKVGPNVHDDSGITEMYGPVVFKGRDFHCYILMTGNWREHT